MTSSTQQVVAPVSGTYRRTSGVATIEVVRLDVDGRHPQMTLSGVRTLSLTSRTHWIAELQSTGEDRWEGSIWLRDGNSFGMPHASVDVQVTRSFANTPSLTLTFGGGGASGETHDYVFDSPFFRDVEFEYDTVEGSAAVTSINTHDHSNRPASLPAESITIEHSFERAGFRVAKSGDDGTIPLANAGVNGTWSDAEMHDAMQTFWSRFDSSAQWSMWVLFAASHDDGNSLGGIMFDDIGPNHRQGTAVFNDSFISQPPIGDSQADAWVRRMKYWTAVHEMGHAFNLAHAWQKALGTPWIPLANEPEARSFMNYPFNVAGGQTAFFRDFDYRFSDSELLFMRHAPERFVQMGNADWFDHHGFEHPEHHLEPSFALELRVNRESAVYEFMEPVNVELKLTNVTGQPKLVDRDGWAEGAVVIIKKRLGEARQWVPFAQRCIEQQVVALEPGESLYEALLVSAGRNGWDLSEPGVYTLQAAMRIEDQPVVSNELRLKIHPPETHQEEVFAQDYFSDEVARALEFGGTRAMANAARAFETLVDQFPKHRAAIHAGVAIANVEAKDYKMLAMDDGDERSLRSAHELGARFRVVSGDKSVAVKAIENAVGKRMEVAAESMGHIRFRECIDQNCSIVSDENGPSSAASMMSEMRATLDKRNVLPSVLHSIDEEVSRYQRAPEGTKRRSSSSKMTSKKSSTRGRKTSTRTKNSSRKKKS